MTFRRPIRVCVCHHSADVSLAKAFRNHAKSLVEDGVIVFNEAPDSAQMVVAVTSSDFDPTQIERAEKAGCRIIPVMARMWRPPKRLKDLKFLPSLDRDVAGAAKPDDVWVEILEGIEKAVDEMAEGKWEPPAISPSMPLSHDFPEYLPYLCDWQKPILKIKSRLGGDPRRPRVLIVLATEKDSHWHFNQRIQLRELAGFLRVENLQPHLETFDWGESFKEQIKAVFSPDRPGLTVLTTAEEGDRWDRRKEKLLSAFLHYWRDRPDLSGTSGVVSIVSILFREMDRASVKRIVKAARSVPHSSVRVAVVKLPEIRSMHAVNWAGIRDVKMLYREDREPRLRQDIRGLYPPLRETLPMADLAPRLIDLIRKYPK